MSLFFNTEWAQQHGCERGMRQQWDMLLNFRQENGATMAGLIRMAQNAGLTPAEAYREMDVTTKLAHVANGRFATLTRLNDVSKSVNLGRKVFDYRKSSEMDAGKTSMSGQTGFDMDQASYDYAGTIVPVHDRGFGIDWRDMLSMRADGFDALVDESREAENGLLKAINSFLWHGSEISYKGRKWGGLKGDPSVATAVLSVDLADPASTPADIRKEVMRVRDILTIGNKCSNPLKLAVSQEIKSNWERYFNEQNSALVTIEQVIKQLSNIDEIYVDPELVGNEISMMWMNMSGLHQVTGMAISTYPMPRLTENANFNFMKWAATGFMAKNDASNNKTAIYAS